MEERKNTLRCAIRDDSMEKQYRFFCLINTTTQIHLSFASEYENIVHAINTWHKLSFEERMNIAQMTNLMFPEAVQDWFADIELMQQEPYQLPDSIQCFLNHLTNALRMPMVNSVLGTILNPNSMLTPGEVKYCDKLYQLDEMVLDQIEKYRRQLQ
jgi:hypothetical protein